jgi:hypothetical protein
MITWDPIAPGEVLLSTINWATRLAAGDSITSSVWSAVTPAGLVAAPAPTVGMLTSVTVSGALASHLGTLFSITNTITTATGQTEVETAIFSCALK